MTKAIASNVGMENDDPMIYLVRGDSMQQPEGDSFPPGTRLYVDDGLSVESLKAGEYAIFYRVDRQDSPHDYFGIYNPGAQRLEFLNPAHEPVPLAGLHFAGRVVESFTTMWRRPNEVVPTA